MAGSYVQGELEKLYVPERERRKYTDDHMYLTAAAWV